MVVDSYSAAAEKGKMSGPPPPPPLPLLQELMGKIHRLPVDAAVAPPPKAPWSMVAIRSQQDDGCNNPFPPINHENLQISTDPPPNANQIPHIHAGDQQLSFSDSDSVSDSDSNSSSTFSPSDSSPSPPSPFFSDPWAADAAGWFDSWMEILYDKVSGLVRLFFSRFTSSRGVFLNFRSATFTAVLMAFLYFRRRRRLRAGEDSRERLIGIIKERDEKINQLLDQISRMNQVLLTLHSVPTSSTP